MVIARDRTVPRPRPLLQLLFFLSARAVELLIGWHLPLDLAIVDRSMVNTPAIIQLLQGLFSKSIRGAETGHFGLISANFDPVYPSYILPFS